MIAVNPEWKGLETIIELRDFSYELSDQKGLPIFAEATEKKTKVTYERYGFKVFDEWKVEAENIHLWFLRRDPLSPY
jgi:hypothetical protein